MRSGHEGICLQNLIIRPVPKEDEFGCVYNDTHNESKQLFSFDT